jgi:hypothetical protein
MDSNFCTRVTAARLSRTLCWLPLAAIAAGDDPKEIERLLAKVQSEPLIFVVVTGEPNACGRGCFEWIAAEGRFDEGAAQRLREFLADLAKRDLPIFFNSDGGLVREAVQIGSILRENRMTSGVARTVPEGCHLSFPLDDACRRLMQSNGEHKARLYYGGARCGSACVYAMIGASTRHVEPGATLRIHSSVSLETDKHENFLRRYVLLMGVDPGLVDAAAKVPSRTFRELSRGEIERFGIETRGVHETPWFAYRGPAKKLVLLKSVTYPTGDPADEYRTRTIARCQWGDSSTPPVAPHRLRAPTGPRRKSIGVGPCSIAVLSANGHSASVSYPTYPCRGLTYCCAGSFDLFAVTPKSLRA